MDFVECPSIWICLMFPHDLIEATHNWKGTRDVILCPLQCIVSGGQMVSIYITCDINLDPLARLGTVKILHWHLKCKTYFHMLKRYLFNICHMPENTVGSRAVTLIPVYKSRWSVKPFKSTCLDLASQDSEPVGLSEVPRRSWQRPGWKGREKQDSGPTLKELSI